MPLDTEPIRLGVSMSALSEAELSEVDRQAEELISLVMPRGRSAVGELLMVIQGAAIAERYHRAAGQSGTAVVSARPDETAPLSHQATDLGYLMALILPLAEAPDAPQAVKQLWGTILRALAAELRRRGPPA